MDNEDIDDISAKEKNTDLLFISIGDFENTYYSIEKTIPKAVFPMHMSAQDNIKYEKSVDKNKFKTKVISFQNRGDRFHYKEGKIEQILFVFNTFQG